MMLLKDVWDAFHKGQALCSSAIWKNRAAATSALVGFVTATLAVAAAFGYRLDIDSYTIEAISGGIVAVVLLFNTGVHIVTSEKVGLPPKPEPAGDGDVQPAGENPPADTNVFGLDNHG